MKIAFTGPRNLTKEQEEYVTQEVRNLLKPGDTAITGACTGLDALVARVAYSMPGVQVYIVVPTDRSQVDPDWRKYCHSSYEMPPGTDYMDRNDMLVKLCQKLVGFPATPEILRSGTWATIRRARKAGKFGELHILSEVVKKG